MDPQLYTRLRELHALAAEGILDADEYAQLKADAIAGHRQMHAATVQLHADTVNTQRGLLQGMLVRQAAVTEARFSSLSCTPSRRLAGTMRCGSMATLAGG